MIKREIKCVSFFCSSLGRWFLPMSRISFGDTKQLDADDCCTEARNQGSDDDGSFQCTLVHVAMGTLYVGGVGIRKEKKIVRHKLTATNKKNKTLEKCKQLK